MTPESPQVHDPASSILDKMRKEHIASITRLRVLKSNLRRETSMNERNVSKELDRLADERWPLTLAVEATPEATLVCAWLTDWPGYISQGSSVNEALARLRVMLPACWAAHLQHGWDYVVSMKPSPTPSATLDNARFSTNDIWASVQWRAGTFRVADLSPHQTDACESH